VHLVGLITKKFVTMHGHMNAKFTNISFIFSNRCSPATHVSPCKKNSFYFRECCLLFPKWERLK